MPGEAGMEWDTAGEYVRFHVTGMPRSLAPGICAIV